MYKGSNFSTASPTLPIAHLSEYSHHSGYEVEFHCGFDLHFTMTNYVDFKLLNLSFNHCIFIMTLRGQE